ncbi:MAG: precorrin-8X methylmutase [Synechococcus sp.]
MEWHASNAEHLACIDRQVGDHGLPPAIYEVVRRAIHATADFDYLHSIHFSENALKFGAASVAARTTIVVDDPMVQVGIVRTIQDTFANPVYCGAETITRPQRAKSEVAWGVETLARRYPEAIFVIGQSAEALSTLVSLITAEEAAPSLIIAAPPSFDPIGKGGPEDAASKLNPKQQLAQLQVPHIVTTGTKGSACVAAAILDGLLDLTWQAYVRKAAAKRRHQEQSQKVQPTVGAAVTA